MNKKCSTIDVFLASKWNFNVNDAILGVDYRCEPTKTRHIDSSCLNRKISKVGEQEDSRYCVVVDLRIVCKVQIMQLLFESDQQEYSKKPSVIMIYEKTYGQRFVADISSLEVKFF